MLMIICIKKIVLIDGIAPLMFKNDTQAFLLMKTQTQQINSTIDIYISESANVSRIPSNLKHICQFKSKLPKFYVYKHKENKGNDVSVSPSTGGAIRIASSLYSKGYIVFLFEKDSSYKIKSEITQIDGYDMAVASDPMWKLISGITANFDLYSSEEDRVSDLICNPSSSMGVFLFVSIISAIILAWIYFLYFVSLSPIQANSSLFWIYDSNLKKVFGPNNDAIDKLANKYLIKCLNKAKESNAPSSFVIRLRRGDHSHTFQRVAAFPIMNDSFVVVVWDENLPEGSNPAFECKFNSSMHGLTVPPSVSFTSFRDIRPVRINFTLDNNVRCVAELPASIIAPFQPYGQLVIVVLSLFHEMNLILSQNPFSDENLPKIVRLCCIKLGIRRSYLIKGDGEIICSYVQQGLNQIPTQQILRIIESNQDLKGFLFVHDLIENGFRCYISRVKGFQHEFIVINELGYDTDNDVLQDLGVPFYNLCALFMYHIWNSHKLSVKYNRYVALFESSPVFTYIEIAYRQRKILTFKSQIIKDSPQTLEDLFEAEKKIGMKDIDIVREEFRRMIKDKSYIKQRIIQVQNDQTLFFSVSAVSNWDDVMQDTIVTIIAEQVTPKKKQELDLISALPDVEKSMKELNVMSFSILNDCIIMDNDSLFEFLGQPSIDRTLERYVIDPDKCKIAPLVDGERVSIRVANTLGNIFEFACSSNKEIGFMFCIDGFPKAKNNLNVFDDRIQMTGSTSMVIFWVVDPINDSVHSLYQQPTIWDVLGCSKEEKFSQFIDHIHSDDRDGFINNYSALLSKSKNQWTGEIRILKISGLYEWHRIVIAYSANGTLHCLAMITQKQKEMEIKLNETRQLRDLLLSCGKLSLWRFIDERKPSVLLTNFTPGVVKGVDMNWDFIEKQVHIDYRESFIEQIHKSFAINGNIEFDFPLVFPNNSQIWVSVRGKANSEQKMIVGVCIDVSELREAYDSLEKERKRAEEANKQKTVFLANMSHEIRTPMNGIFGMLDVLSIQELTSEQRLLIDSIRSSSYQLMKLLDDTLNLTKIEQGSFETNFVVFDLSAFIEPIVIACSSRAHLNKILLNVNVKYPFPSLIYGDPQLFGQVINNLLSNALKFTKQGEITVKLSWEIDNYDDEICLLEVKDTGIGITKDQQRIIFDRFAQADASVARYFGGTGLGLSLVQEIARFLGGEISLESEPGVGSTFIASIPFKSAMFPYSHPSLSIVYVILYIKNTNIAQSFQEWLPNYHYELIQCAEPEEIEEQIMNKKVIAIFVEGNHQKWKQIKDMLERKKDSPHVISLCMAGESSVFKQNITKPVMIHHVLKHLHAIRFGKQAPESLTPTIIREEQTKRILVVEDNKANQFVMKKILDNLRCTYAIAENGLEAIEKLAHEEFDMVFMDCQMPVLDGIEATKRIRVSEEPFKSIPIVALTASAVEGDEQVCLNAGMDAYLAKPVRISQIQETIKRFSKH